MTSPAVAAHLNAILRCYTRETAIPVAVGPLTFKADNSTVTARVEHASRTGLHRFTDVLVDGAPPAPEDLVRLLSADADPAEVDDLVPPACRDVEHIAWFEIHGEEVVAGRRVVGGGQLGDAHT